MAVSSWTRRSLAWSLIACGVLIAPLLPGPARATSYMDDYRDFRRDYDVPFRIDSTTRSVWTGTDGRRWLMVAVTPLHVCCGRDQSVDVFLDTDGDRTADWKVDLRAENTPSGGTKAACHVERHGSSSWRRAYIRFEEGFIDGFMACHVPLGLIQPSARIAWFVRAVVTYHPHFGPGEFWRDRAPDVGWYV